MRTHSAPTKGIRNVVLPLLLGLVGCFTKVHISPQADAPYQPAEASAPGPDQAIQEAAPAPVDLSIDAFKDSPLTSTGGTGGFDVGGEAQVASGGSGGAGGIVGAGGITSSGGIVGTGGIPPSGGIVGSGGNVATGGIVATGGGTRTGGITGSGGSTGGSTTCTLQTDCSGPNYCRITSGTTGTCAPKNPNGTPAAQTFECASGIVADGVCCDKACTGCSACSGAPLTAAAAGQCAFVVAGQVAHSACTASGVSCGLDGKCDGAGACRYSPAEGASCNDPSNLCVTGRICQNHVCTTGTTKSCPPPTQTCRNAGVCDPATGNCNYGLAAVNTPCDDGDSCTTPDLCLSNGQCAGAQILCNSPPACKLSTTCSAGACNYTLNASNGTADAKCPGGTPYCYSGSCVQCTTDSHCSGVTPSCDPNSHACGCRKPSSGNILTNPGFDGSMNGWTPSAPPPNGPVLAADSDGCPGSNSVYTENGEWDPWQCIPVTAGRSYSVGGKFKGGGLGGPGIRLVWYTGPNCTGTAGYNWNMPIEGSSNWGPQWSAFVPPAGTVSAKIGLWVMQQYFDQLYVNPDANQF